MSFLRNVNVATIAIVVAIVFGPATSIAKDASVPADTCAELTQLIVEKKVSDIATLLAEASHGLISRNLEEPLEALEEAASSRKALSNHQLAVKPYGDGFVRVWRVIAYRDLMLFVRCTYIDIDDDWVLYDFTFDSEEEDIDLP